MQEEIIQAEGRMNSRGLLRYHVQSDIKERTEEVFKNRCIEQRVEWDTPDFYERQVEFFAGACAVLDEIPPYWGVCLMSNRSIINEYKL
jgi:hypothetical protein